MRLEHFQPTVNSRRIDVQSLKSTAFAVTLLAISFGLYCVSTNNNAVTENEHDLIDPIDPIQIDSSLSTSSNGSMSLPSLDTSTIPPAIQISTNAVSTPSPSNSFPDLPSLQTPNLQAPKTQLSNSLPNLGSARKEQTPLKLPSLSTPSISSPATVSSSPVSLPSTSSSTGSSSRSNTPLKLPELATRQPVSTSLAPATRDDGLIDALKTNEFKPQISASNGSGTSNTFQAKPSFTTTQPAGNDRSYNALATAIAKDDEVASVGTATASPGSGVRNQPPALNAPTSIASVWTEVDRLVAADEYRKALGLLSKNYGKKGLTGPQQQKLQGWLDALAGKVIYSTEHHFVNRPYVVRNGDTLESISSQLKIPSEVIYNINRAQFAGRNEVAPGMELKVVNGPFHAEVDLDAKMMTLFIKNLYAGRFPVAVGISGNPDQGNFDVKVKSPNGFTWRDATGKEYPAGSPGNGYGPYWIGLSGSLCIHAVAEGTPHGHRGCIGLSEDDAKDVFGILSRDSKLSIVR